MPELNRLDYSGTEDDPWDEPALEDFGVGSEWDELGPEEQREVEDNFLINKAEDSPPPDFGDLALPVVDPQGDLDPSNDRLNENAVSNADARVNQVEDVPQSLRERANRRLDRLQASEFGLSKDEAFE